MVDAIVSSAIVKLGEFITHEVNIRIGVKDGARWLKNELGYLQASVRYAESRQEEELIRNWVNEVRDVASDAVTVLSDFNALQQEHAAPKHGILNRFRDCVCIFKKEVVHYDIGKEIESLKERIDGLKQRRTEYHIDNILATPNVQQQQRTFLRTTAINNQVDVIGFEDDIKTLTGELNSKHLSLKVISIHGMGGLGKTSLATKLYNSSELRKFDIRAKVCVSNDYEVKDVLKRIVKSFMGPEHEKYLSNMDEHDLVQYLPKLLNRRRYLALIDDIWDIKAWDQIKIAFPNQKNGSRIIITTRNKKVAEMVDDKCFVHQLSFLTKEESWQLFCKRAEPTTPNLEKLGREVVGKCRGLPLAIVVLSGLLFHNMSNDYWSMVKEQIWRQLREGDSFQIEEILSLSYNDLSPQMRDCFLYLSRYPEDHEINPEELKRLWIAEGFISEAEEGEGVVMEDLAKNILNELISRNLLQVAKSLFNERVLFCRVHDLVRDLAINKAKEHKLLVVLDSGKDHPDPIHLFKGQPRHVIYNGLGEYLKLLDDRRFDASYLRSLALVKYWSEVEVKAMELVCTRFKNLKVLDVRSVYSKRIPKEIGNLVLLKYLGLMGGSSGYTKPLKIPPCIGKLKKLQTLLGAEERRYTFPREICELHELRFLVIEISGSLNIGNHQTKLHTLGSIHPEEWMKIDTVNLTNLHTLFIRELEKKRGAHGYTLESVTNLTSLQTFTLAFNYSDIPTIRPLSSCNRLKSVSLLGILKDPSELRFLPDSVTELTLSCSKFTEDPMPTLGSLSNLTALDLNMVYPGKKMVCSHNAFPSLQYLRLVSFPDLEELKVEDGAFRSLKQFQTVHCDKLKKIAVQLELGLSKKKPNSPNRTGPNRPNRLFRFFGRFGLVKQ